MKKELLQAVLDNKIFYNRNARLEQTKKDFTQEEFNNADLIVKIIGKELVLYITLDDYGKPYDETVSFPCGLITKSGYISTKKMPVSFDYSNEVELTNEQLSEILPYLSDSKSTNYDPFFSKNKANANAQAALVALANNITDPYDIG